MVIGLQHSGIQQRLAHQSTASSADNQNRNNINNKTSAPPIEHNMQRVALESRSMAVMLAMSKKSMAASASAGRGRGGVGGQHGRMPAIQWCRPQGFRAAIPQRDSVVALASFPGSGNTWVRYLLQQATGIITGSIYKDHALLRNGFPGRVTTICRPTVD